MGARSSKVTVVQACDGDSPPTDAELLKAIRSEYTNAKHRNSAGRVAWDFQDYVFHNKERDSDDVSLVDNKESAQDSTFETTTPPGGGGFPAGKSDKHTHVQASGQVATVVKACVRETVAAATHSLGLHSQKHVNGAGRGSDRKDATSPADSIHTKSSAVPAGCESLATGAASKHKRPLTGNPKHGRHKTEGKARMTAHPSAASPAGAAATTAAAATANSGSARRDHGGAQTQNANSVPITTTDRPLPAPPQTNPAGKADAAPATPPAITDAQTSDSAATTGVANSVQWVIRPGPPIESAYKLGKVLGQGSFGMVRAATHIATNAEVAVKTIRKSMLRAADITSLRREVEILHHLAGHPHISQILGVYEEARQLHLVLELYKGGDLFDAIIGNGRHSERTAADVMRTVLTAIGYCHAMGVAHRDIKPENFMLTAELPKDFQDKAAPSPPTAQQQQQQQEQQQQASGGRQIPLAPTLVGIGARLKLIDFGLSAFCTDDTPLTEIVGTSYYVAPEVLDGRYSLPADVWSAGVILFIMLTGYAPFDGKDDREILRAVRKGNLDLTKDSVWKSISPEAVAVVMTMLDRDPKRRATADQILSMPWIGRTADVCVAPTAPLPGVVSERLHRFARMSSFKKEARRVVAGFMRPEEVAGLVAQFQSLDVDKDGRINLAELREGLARQSLLKGGSVQAAQLSEEQLRNLLRRSDLNGDGLLDESEFLGAALPAAALARQALTAAAAGGSRPVSGQDQPPNALAGAFKHFDLDGSGYITVEELRKALATHHPSGKATDFQALLARHDRDNDGLISYPEFVEMLVQDIDDEEEDGVMYDAAVHSLPQRQTRLRQPASGSHAGRTSNPRISRGGVAGNVSINDGNSSQTLQSRESATAWGVGGGDPRTGATVTHAATAAAKVRGDGRAAVPSGSGSPVSGNAAQNPGFRISPFEWSDECTGGDDGTAATAMTVAAGRYDTVLEPAAIKPSDAAMMGVPQAAAARSSVNGGSPALGGIPSSAPRIPSRLSQTQLPPNSLQPFSTAVHDAPASAMTPRLSVRIGSGSSNRRASIGGCSPSPSEGMDAGSGGLYRLGEPSDFANGQAGVYGGFLNGGAANTAGPISSAQAPSPSQRSGQRVPPPPRLQLPVQPVADLRSRRHSAGGMVPDSRGLLVVIGGGGSSGGGSGGGSPAHPGDLRPGAHAPRVHNPAAGRGLTTPGAPLDLLGLGSNFNDLQGTANARAVAGDAGGTVSLPGSPSAASAAAAAQRIVAGRLSTGSGAAISSPQHQRIPALQPLPSSHLGLQATLPTLAIPLGPAGGGDRLTEHASCPLTTVSGWPLSPGGPAPARPSRASVTGMMPARGPGPCWPAPVVTSVTTSGGAVRPAPPSEPLPVLHSTGVRSRRQSTGGPASPLFHPTGLSVPAAVTPQLLPAQHHPQHPHQQHASGQHTQRHNLTISCNGGSGCSSNGNSNNTLSPRVPTPVQSDWPSGGAIGAIATATAGRRSRRTTQPGLLPLNCGEDLILTSRASMDLDVGMSATTDETTLNNYVLPPGATGQGFGAPYKPLLTSGSGRLL